MAQREHPENERELTLSRSELLKRASLLGGLALTAPGVLAACGGGGGAATSAPPSSSATETGAVSTTQGAPKKGGTLRVGFVGNGVTETLDPNASVASTDIGRACNLFDQLVRLKPDLTLEHVLAESFEPNAAADVWTIRLRSGVTWHDGSSFTADDVIYTFKRINDPQSALSGKETTRFIDFSGLKKSDPLTLIVPLVQPNSEFPSFFTIPYWQIVKNGETDFKHPIGTGPFKFVSWTPGQQSLFVKNENYWDDGKPYVDQLQMIDIPDQTARLNALVGGQIDAMENMSFPQAKTEKDAGRVTVLEAPGSNMVPIYMATTLEPFTDVRVRQAMRLIADRQQLLNVAQLGFGEVGNDLYGKGLPFYDSNLAQREQDIEQAKSLLKAAGKEGLSVTLYSSNAAAGMLESATAFAEQAKQAGVTIDVQNVPSDQYFGQKYLKQNFAQSLWFAEPIIGHMTKSLAKGAPFNETHWSDPTFQSNYDELLRTVDETKRAELYNALQQQLWNEGGYLIWGFFPLVDGLATNIRGVVPNPAQPLSHYNFKNYWLA